MTKRIRALLAAVPLAASLCAAAPPTARASSDDVMIRANPCKKKFHQGCMTARQISRYGVAHYWEVLYADVEGKLDLVANSPYGVAIEEDCGRQGYKYLKTLSPAPVYMRDEVLRASQDVKEQCELDRLKADGLEAVNKALNVKARDLSAFRVYRIAKADLPSAPPQFQALLALAAAPPEAAP